MHMERDIAHTSRDVPKLVPTRTRHPQPNAYVVPLVERGENALSSLVAVTNWLTDDDLTAQGQCTIFEALRVYVLGFGCYEHPFNDGAEVVRARLGIVPLELAASVFARGDIAAYPWTTGSGNDFVRQFMTAHAGSAHVVPISPSCFVLRSGELPLGLDQAVPTGGAFWQERPATQVVDLDSVFRMNAIRGLRAVMGDLIPASGSLAFERAILDGRGHKWTGASFLSPGATREMYQRERIESLDRLGSSSFRLPVARQRWHLVGPAVCRRARESSHTNRDEVIEGRRRNLAVVLPQIVAEEIGQYEQAIMASPPWPLPAYAACFEEFRNGLMVKVQRALNAAFTEDYLEDPKWRRELRASHVTYDEAEATDPAFRVEARTPEINSGTIREVLNDRFGRVLLTRAKLTLKQETVLAAFLTLEPGDTLTDWARRNGMNPKTAYVHVCNAKRRLDRAKKLP